MSLTLTTWRVTFSSELFLSISPQVPCAVIEPMRNANGLGSFSLSWVWLGAQGRSSCRWWGSNSLRDHGDIRFDGGISALKPRSDDIIHQCSGQDSSFRFLFSARSISSPPAFGTCGRAVLKIRLIHSTGPCTVCKKKPQYRCRLWTLFLL